MSESTSLIFFLEFNISEFRLKIASYSVNFNNYCKFLYHYCFAYTAMEEDIPTIESAESVTDYFSRTKDFWLELADNEAEESGIEITGKQLKKRAFALAEEHFKQ